MAGPVRSLSIAVCLVAAVSAVTTSNGSINSFSTNSTPPVNFTSVKTSTSTTITTTYVTTAQPKLTTINSHAKQYSTWIHIGAPGVDVEKIWKESLSAATASSASLSAASLSSVTAPGLVAEAAMCRRLPGLSAGQSKLCQLYGDHMTAVARGASAAIAECGYQFQHRRWNCSTSALQPKPLSSLLRTGSREVAFLHALSAAGVSYAVSRACRDGQLSSCGCARSARPRDLKRDWVWGGCGDNLEYGYKFTQSFVDVRERERRPRKGSREQGRQLMNLHNNEAGRRAVIKKASVTCKCHGVSGSCSLITCWQQLASFREIGEYLKEKYSGATEVRASRKGRLQLRDTRYQLPTANDLVYVGDSPNYCVRDVTIGSLGTHGRECNKNSAGLDGCNLLCCGRGYNTRKVSIKEHCECKFHWCCKVECKTCVRNTDIHTCK